MSKSYPTAPLLVSIRPQFASACDLEKPGPFLAVVTFRSGSVDNSVLEAVGQEVNRLALGCVWPQTWICHGSPILRWCASEGAAGDPREMVYEVDHQQRLEDYKRLAGQAAARVPDAKLRSSEPITDASLSCGTPPHLAPDDLWTKFVYRCLRKAKLLRSRAILDAHAWLFWYDADAFSASMAAIDRLTHGMNSAPSGGLGHNEILEWSTANTLPAAGQALVNLDTVDFAAILDLAGPLLTRVRRLAEWEHDGCIGPASGDMLLQATEQWTALEAALVGRQPSIDG
jgi:hypothetical protein